MEEKKKVGRPTDYTPELGKEICDEISGSSKGLRQLCKENEHWPERRNIYHWLKKHEEFQLQYAQAKKCQVETFIDEILEIADDTSNDTIVKIDHDGNEKEVCNSEWINRSRLKVDTRKWLCSKLVPKLYGNMSDATVHLNFPSDLTKGSALLPMSAEVFRALGNREITPDQAHTLLSTLKVHATNMVVIDFERQLNEMREEFDAKV